MSSRNARGRGRDRRGERRCRQGRSRAERWTCPRRWRPEARTGTARRASRLPRRPPLGRQPGRGPRSRCSTPTRPMAKSRSPVGRFPRERWAGSHARRSLTPYGPQRGPVDELGECLPRGAAGDTVGSHNFVLAGNAHQVGTGRTRCPQPASRPRSYLTVRAGAWDPLGLEPDGVQSRFPR